MELDLKNLQSALEQLEVERGISKEKILETIEMALAAAYKKDYGKRGQIIRAKLNPETGKLEFTQVKIVVDQSMIKEVQDKDSEEDAESYHPEPAKAKDAEKRAKSKDRKTKDTEENQEQEEESYQIRFNPERHIMIEEAKKIKKGVKPEEEIIFPLETKKDYGRIAAQTAKQVITQRVREAERESIFEEFKEKQGEVISGIVQRIEGRNVFIDLGRAVGILPKEEQVRGERYRIGERIKALLFLIEKEATGSGVYLSRTHPRLVAKLFEMEVPEIANGAVDIKSIAREAGSRSKISVISNEEGIDPVGSCVGQKGIRVGTVISELGGEKIDIIEWSEEPAAYIAHALSPAKVLDIEISPEKKEAKAMVSEDQLSLAIGRGGQNVRLAAKLTGWKIDIRSKSGESVAQATEKGEVSGEGIIAPDLKPSDAAYSPPEKDK